MRPRGHAQKIMALMWHIVVESFRQAWGQLNTNRLRAFLSLLGITIGIFCIIAVKSAVDSLENDLRNSLNRLGSDVLYINKLPWNEDPGMSYWKYNRRPAPNYKEFLFLQKNLRHASLVGYSFFVGAKTVKWGGNSVDNGFVLGVTNDYGQLFDIKMSSGRFFTASEYAQSAPVVVIGSVVAGRLFGDADPVGRDVQMLGRRVRVIGLVEKKGESVINVANYDEALLIPYSLAEMVTNTKATNPFATLIAVKPVSGYSEKAFKDEVVLALRRARRLQPYLDNNFAVNQTSILQGLLSSVFQSLNIAGLLIGVFAMLVGVFSVANIMFVSVKERTAMIGIKKALGARRGVILLEFLIESVVLCILGGALGLLLVGVGMWVGAQVLAFNLFLSWQNAVSGTVLSVLVGIVSGLLPAWQAAQMDPVEAMRQ